MRTTILLLLLLGLACPAMAQTVFSLDPAQAMAGETVNLRVDDPFGCFSGGLPEIVRDGSVVAVRFYIDDSVPPGGCPPTWMTPRTHSLGTFTPGIYEVRVTTCTNAPPTLPPCELHTSLTLTVFGSSGTTFTVPTLSDVATLGLVLLMMTMGVLVARTSQCHPGKGCD
jgi:hypothetical protein